MSNDLKGGDIASKQEELDLYANVIPIYDEYPESDSEEFVEALEEVVETSCVEVVHDLESMVELLLKALEILKRLLKHLVKR